MEVRFILGLILFAFVNNVFQELLPVTNCNKRIVRFLGGIYFFRKRLPLSNSLLMDNFSFAREVGSHLEPRIWAQYGRTGGGGGYFRNFWVGMCRWDPWTLSLYQSYFSWIFLPFTRLKCPNLPYPRVAFRLSCVSLNLRFDFFEWQFPLFLVKIKNELNSFLEMIPYSRPPKNSLIYIPYPRGNCLKPYPSQRHIPI